MAHQTVLAASVSPLCSWYRQNKRNLPFRETKDPYKIWVSEIMLQQTRVEAAVPYYHRFLEALPTVADLAAAPLAHLMKLWEGLGYYSRVKNMQKAAILLCEQYGGQFPADVKELEKLPGIGDYTAGAIASIAFDLPVPAVDGNVLRVAARLLNDDADIMRPQTKRQIKESLMAVYPLSESASDLTQGLMELGALVCVPGTPKCSLCPLVSLCEAKKAGRQEQLPVREVKKEKKVIKRTLFLLVCGNQAAIVKRPESGVLAGMWEFPGLERQVMPKSVQQVLKTWEVSGAAETFITHRHVFTHLIWDMSSYLVQTKEKNSRFSWVSLSELTDKIALPSAFKPFLRALLQKLSTES